MNFNFKCKICNWKSFIDPKLFYNSEHIVYNCTKCGSLYEIEEEDVGIKF